MTSHQIEGLKGVASILAGVFPGVAPAILLGSSFLDLLRQNGIQGERFEELVQQLTRKVSESAADRRQSLTDLEKLLDRFAFVDEE